MTVQSWVPGFSRVVAVLAFIVTGSAKVVAEGTGELPMLVVVPSTMQVILLFVAPANTDEAVTVRLVSGLSVAVISVASVAMVESVHFAFWVTVFVTAVELSFEKPVGAPVSIT